MKIKFSQYSFLAIIAMLITIICIYNLIKDTGDIEGYSEGNYKFSATEKEYIRNHDNISIYVDENLRYLMEWDKNETAHSNGYLSEYMHIVFGAAGINFQFTDNKKSADCSLMIVTDKIRENSQHIKYTAPVFEVDGALFTASDINTDGDLTGFVMDDRLTPKELEKLQYKGSGLSYSFEKNAEKVVNSAVETEADFIIGDKSAVIKAFDGDNRYIAAEKTIYSKNVCIITDNDQILLYSILNECIHNSDRQDLTYALSQKWFQGNGPLYMKDENEDIYMIMLIIMAAVFIAFFIYYLANKNLYHELNERMEIITDSRQELKTTFNSVRYYMAELDLEGNITDINRAFYNYIKKDIFNNKIWDVLEMDEESSEKLKTMIKLASNSDSIQKELMLKKQVLVIDVFPIENARGSIDKLLFVAMDVTNERMAERQMLQDNKMIAVGQLAAGVAHEIRNPLGIIRNYCYVLKNMEDEEIRGKAIEHIEKAVDKSGNIINNLLNFSKASSRRREMIDIEEHVRTLTLLNENILKKKNINMRIVCPERLKAYLLVESLDIILINLIQNATDAMSENGNLIITATKNNDNMEIQVEDTGHGIEEDILQDIFNPFFTTKERDKGTGLGLYIVYNEVAKMRGTIEVESTVNVGSKFRLMLPLENSENTVEEVETND